MRIEYYRSATSPWCYLAGQRHEGIAARAGAEIRYIPVDPVQLFARTGGVALADRHENRKAYRLQELRRHSAHLGLPLTLRPAHFPTNAAPAAYAIIAAQAAGGGDLGGLVHALMRACWAEEKNIAEDDVIRAALEAHAFDPDLADRGLFVGAETYGRNLEDAVAAGVFGVPFYIVGDERFWGQDRLDFLARHLGVSA